MTQRLLFLAVLSIAVSLPEPALALPGVGGLAKKAKEKAAKAAGVEDEAPASDQNVVFDGVVLELTGERLDRVIATFQKSKSVAAERPALADKMDKASMERGSVWDKEGEAVRELQQKRDDVEGCYHDGYNEMTERRMQEYSQNALTDPGIRDKFTRIAQQYNAAAASGDTAAIRAAQTAMHSVILPTREDSVGVRERCGPLPPRSGAEEKLDALDRQIASLAAQIRKIDEKVSEAQAGTGGMDRQAFAVATERIQMYLAWRKSKSYKKSSTRGFTAEEIEAMEKRLEELSAALN